MSRIAGKASSSDAILSVYLSYVTSMSSEDFNTSDFDSVQASLRKELKIGEKGN